MSSTYVHYSTPSSLPSDYALLSRYAAARNINNLDDQAEDNEEPVPSDDTLTSIDSEDFSTGAETAPFPIPRPGRLTRRSSFPTSYIRPINPTMGPLPDKAGHRSGPNPPQPSENTPLLAPLVPRIQEEVDGEDLRPGSAKRQSAVWEEIKILSKYTLPVFG